MNPSAPPEIKVSVDEGKAEKTEHLFCGAFKIGRDAECEVRLNHSKVSRLHAEVRFSEGEWLLFDLKSTNGVYLNGRKQERIALSDGTRVQLGLDGPVLCFSIQEPARKPKEPAQDLSKDHYLKHYFGKRQDENVGAHTMMIRTVYGQLQKRQKRRFQMMIAVLVCLLFGAGIFAVHKHNELKQQKALAEDIFYAVKSLEIEFADLLRVSRQSQSAQSLENVRRYQARRAELEKKYNEFVKGLDIYGESKSEEERVILSVARTFGECEVAMPAPFVKEVLNYVAKWKSTPRLTRALDMAKKNGYIEKIAETMQAHGLPPQFLYLGLQESSFNVNACGPPTNYGIAKGMWQFIPTTGRSYGLRTGPLAELQQPDPEDERHDFLKSTQAAAEYIRYIYDTQAQASGLLVMASYNWGENRVIKLINTMPENPKERNFWRLLTQYREKMPQETYDYVFYIVSAAVIGENPKLFGFDFENPLARVQK